MAKKKGINTCTLPTSQNWDNPNNQCGKALKSNDLCILFLLTYFKIGNGEV